MFGFTRGHLINAYGAQWHTQEIKNKDEVEQSIEFIVSEVLRK